MMKIKVPISYMLYLLLFIYCDFGMVELYCKIVLDNIFQDHDVQMWMLLKNKIGAVSHYI